MIVCQCKGVSDAVIRSAIREGATTVAGVGMACRAGTDCGGCHPIIERLIEIELAPTLPGIERDALPVERWPASSILDLTCAHE